MRVAIAGADLAGLSCTKYLTDAGHTPIVWKSQDVSASLIAAWQDNKGDWYEKLRVFFGTYPKMKLQLLTKHATIFNQPNNLGMHSTVNSDLPALVHKIVVILRHNDMLSWGEKIELAKSAISMHFGNDNTLKLLKYYVVKTPRSFDTATLARQDDRFSPQMRNNFYRNRSDTMQPYLGSMEGAVLSGKLTAQAINAAHQSANSYSLQMQNIQPATNAATA